MEVVTYEYLVYYENCSDLNQGLTIARASETSSGKNPQISDKIQGLWLKILEHLF